jgi:Tfp pilus assembly protein PilZ
MPYKVSTQSEATWQDLFKRRKVPRRSIETRVGVLASGEYYLSWAYEIGEGGMLIASQKPLTVGQRVVITFRIPDVVHKAVFGRVVYEKLHITHEGEGYRYGVAFENVDFETKRKIRNFVASATKYAPTE